MRIKYGVKLKILIILSKLESNMRQDITSRSLSFLFLFLFTSFVFAADLTRYNDRTHCEWKDAKTFGSSTVCDSSKLVYGICGSGGNPDCPNGKTNQIQCCQPHNAKSDINPISLQVPPPNKEWGAKLACPDGQAVVNVCGSGGSPDCGGHTSNLIVCATPLVGTIAPGGVWGKPTKWGVTASCQKGEVVTGICGSNTNPFCRQGDKTLWNQVRCSKYDQPLSQQVSTYGTNRWGWMLEVNQNEFMTGWCGSGDNLDCRGSNIDASNSAEVTPLANSITSRRVISDSQGVTMTNPSTVEMQNPPVSTVWGEHLECPAGQVLVGACGSGGYPNCGNYTDTGIKNLIYCALPKQGSVLSDGEWLTPTKYGQQTQCPQGKVATGMCGSNSNPWCVKDGIRLWNQIKCSTFRLPPDAAPNNVAVQSGQMIRGWKSSTQKAAIKVTWNASVGVYPATGYKVYYQRTSSESPSYKSCESPCVIDNLHNNEDYRFWVTAKNEAGDGPKSKQVAVMTESENTQVFGRGDVYGLREGGSVTISPMPAGTSKKITSSRVGNPSFSLLIPSNTQKVNVLGNPQNCKASEVPLTAFDRVEDIEGVSFSLNISCRNTNLFVSTNDGLHTFNASGGQLAQGVVANENLSFNEVLSSQSMLYALTPTQSSRKITYWPLDNTGAIKSLIGTAVPIGDYPYSAALKGNYLYLTADKAVNLYSHSASNLSLSATYSIADRATDIITTDRSAYVVGGTNIYRFERNPSDGRLNSETRTKMDLQAGPISLAVPAAGTKMYTARRLKSGKGFRIDIINQNPLGVLAEGPVLSGNPGVIRINPTGTILYVSVGSNKIYAYELPLTKTNGVFKSKSLTINNISNIDDFVIDPNGYLFVTTTSHGSESTYHIRAYSVQSSFKDLEYTSIGSPLSISTAGSKITLNEVWANP